MEINFTSLALKAQQIFVWKCMDSLKPFMLYLKHHFGGGLGIIKGLGCLAWFKTSHVVNDPLCLYFIRMSYLHDIVNPFHPKGFPIDE